MHPSRLPAVLALAGLLAACETPTPDGAAQATAPRADGVVAIGTVQGTGEASPRLGQGVTIEGVVTGNFRQNLGGWFVQDAGDGDHDGNDEKRMTL